MQHLWHVGGGLGDRGRAVHAEQVRVHGLEMQLLAHDSLAGRGRDPSVGSRVEDRGVTVPVVVRARLHRGPIRGWR